MSGSNTYVLGTTCDAILFCSRSYFENLNWISFLVCLLICFGCCCLSKLSLLVYDDTVVNHRTSPSAPVVLPWTGPCEVCSK